MIKNFEYAKVLDFAGQVNCQEGQVVSKTLAQNEHHSVTLFAFGKGEEISSHESGGDALLVALEGTGEITVDGKKHTVKAGESILMPARHPHAIYAPEQFKMFLVVIF
jgi:quercetin dioxygenase-like cupin family protein